MKILDALRGRRREQTQNATTTYWSLLQQNQANPKDATRSADALDAAMRSIGKSPADAEADLELLVELANLGDLAAQRAAVEKQSDELRSKLRTTRVEAEAARKRSVQLTDEADVLERRRQALSNGQKAAESQRTRILRQLASRGFPTATSHVQQIARENELRQVRSEIVEAEKLLVEAETVARQGSPAAAGHLARRRRERDRLRQRERELQEPMPEAAAQ